MTTDTGTTATEFPNGGHHPPLAASRRRSPDKTLGRHLLEAAMTPAQIRRFRHAPGLRVVIEAPTPAWVEPLRSAAMGMADWHLAVGVDGIPGRSRCTATGGDPTVTAIDAGHRLVAVSHAPGRLLPRALVDLADMGIRTGHPTSAVIRKVIRDATGVEPGITSESLGDRLDYFDLVAAIQVGSDVRSCLRKLGSATANRAVVDRFPADDTDPKDLHGYGEAAPWAGRLVADVEAWRRGEIADFPFQDRHAVLCGPDGSGRSSLVAAIARSVRLPLIATRVPSWFADGASCADRVPHQAEVTLARAADAAPAILLLDAIDALPGGPAVGYVARFLDAIASGGPASPKLVVVGTASFRDAVDPALVGPGRFPRIVEIPPPDDGAIPEILRRHLGEDLDGVCLAAVVALASGSTGATLAGWVRDARRRARAARRPMAIEDLVAEASAPGNRAPTSWLRSAVRETFRTVEAGNARSSPGRPATPRTTGDRGRRMAGSRQGEVGRKGRRHRADHRRGVGRTGGRDRIRAGGCHPFLPLRQGTVIAEDPPPAAAPAPPRPAQASCGRVRHRRLRRDPVQEIRNPDPRSSHDETHRPSFRPLTSGAQATHASSLRTPARGPKCHPSSSPPTTISVIRAS